MKKRAEFRLGTDGESLSCVHVRAIDPVGQVLLMHGAGTGNKRRYLPIIESLVAVNLDVVAFDFSGHGDSTGTLPELSLQRRLVQAQAVLAHCQAPHLPLILTGFSMSGQTACDIVASQQSLDAAAMALCVPAAYAEDVHTLRFGDSAFTQGLRRHRSWLTSTAFGTLRDYPGQVLIIEAEHDDVIPTDVIQNMLSSRGHRPTRHVTLPSPHKVAAWLADKPEQRQRIATLIRGLVTGG